jgi:MFS family permease
VLGLVLSLAFARDTVAHARVESRESLRGAASHPSFRSIFSRTSFSNPALFAASQAGLVNNLNDGLAWGLLPLFLAASGLDLTRIGVVAAIYPAVWGVGQLATGALSDQWGRRGMITWGMWIQAGALVLIAATPKLAPSADARFSLWIAAAVLLGLGTALVYPTLLAAIADVVDPGWRASAMGVYRFWRDLGYAVGAVLAGVLADFLGSGWAFAAVATLTFASGAHVALKMRTSSRKSPA